MSMHLSKAFNILLHIPLAIIYWWTVDISFHNNVHISRQVSNSCKNCMVDLKTYMWDILLYTYFNITTSLPGVYEKYAL